MANYLNPSMINYIPASETDTFDRSISSTLEGSELNAITQSLSDDASFPTSLTKYHQGEAGPWDSHRFANKRWPCSGVFAEKGDQNGCRNNEGALSKNLMARSLFCLEQCPELKRHALVKCVLSNLNLHDINLLKCYGYIQYLDISGNQLSDLNSLGHLPFLKYLNASHNSLETVLDFKSPQFLCSVNLSHNNIKSIPDLSNFWSIVDLSLAHNNIKYIDGLENLKFLVTLDLSHNIIEIVENLNNMRIRFLYLQNNYISECHEDENRGLFTLKNLRTLNLSHNLLESLRFFQRVKNLETLEITHNHVSQLLDICYLRNLKYLVTLNLSSNPVSKLNRYLEVCFTNIKNLVTLDNEKIHSEYWRQKYNEQRAGVPRGATNQRLKLLILEQFNEPVVWGSILPFDRSPVGVIVLVGPCGSNRNAICKKFRTIHRIVEMGILHTTRPKYDGETEGIEYYFVSGWDFEQMLKNGEFLTCSEMFGHRYGLAHQEFEKSASRVLMLRTDLTAALVLKTKFLNAKLVLALPSTQNAHMALLKRRYSYSVIDLETEVLVKTSDPDRNLLEEHAKRSRLILEREIRSLLDDLIEEICLWEYQRFLLKIKSVGGSMDSECLQLWRWFGSEWSALSYRQRLSMSEDIQKKSTSSNVNSARKISNQATVSLTSSKKCVSFSDDGDVGRRSSIESKQSAEPSVAKFDDLLTNLPSIRHQEAKDVEYITYTDSGIESSKLWTVFKTVMESRKYLLDLHWSTPGLFRDLIFTDDEGESLEKLKHLLGHMVKLANKNPKPIIDFSNDTTYNAMMKTKLRKCFLDLDSHQVQVAGRSIIVRD
ncbi:leucine-rich repeat and guanylate kinase domain-containing protein-like isoform X2 [Cylas formicarius]|uniref:leucine-rich repeat and guanylate kinase domain-containing protein-like isoform X2 n=1 Tax=Cylas formicarius TaxID=197179 RepID=UPI0029585009|nr:leucine-rich repeat and guanylate kinase domain-containing protein-like isoform X2 [Cylas formicarius]